MTIAIHGVAGTWLLWVACCLSLTICAISLRGEPPQPFHYKDGAPPDMTGGFGDKTCHSCHFDQMLDNPEGLLEVSGIPASYQPDSSYVITLRISRPELGKAGFALRVRFDEDSPAGQLSPLDSSVTTSGDADANPYATHTEAGTVVAKDTATFRVSWTAPTESDRTAVFNVAANAANGDDSEFGDWIYVLEAVSQPN